MLRKGINLCFCVIFLLSLSACSAAPAVAPEALPVVHEAEPKWVTIQVMSLKILETPSDLDQVDEFRLILIAGDENPANTARFVYPATHAISARVGEEVPGGNYGISANARALNGKLYVYFAGIDSDELSKAGNITLDLLTSVAADAFGMVITGGAPIVSDAASIITELVLGELSASLQEDDIIGDGMLVLQASENWGAGNTRTVTSANGGLALTYRITVSESGPIHSAAASNLPENYLLFDDFSQDNSRDRWWLDGTGQICMTGIDAGQWVYQCTNSSSDDLQATLHPNGIPRGAAGIYTVMKVAQSGGIAKPITNWVCDDPALERAYHFELGYDYAKAVEFYPQEDWRSVDLKLVPVTPGEAHALQIERVNDTIQFTLDGKSLALDTAPNLPACAMMRDWGFDFGVWPDHNTVAGQIDLVGIRYSQP